MIIALHLLDLVRQPCPQRESQRGKEGEGEAKKDFREQVRDEQRVLRERERQGTCYGMGVGRSSEEEGAARRGSTGHVIFLAYSVRGAINGLCAHARAREDSTRAIMKCCGESQSCARGILRIAVGHLTKILLSTTWTARPPHCQCRRLDKPLRRTLCRGGLGG